MKVIIIGICTLFVTALQKKPLKKYEIIEVQKDTRGYVNHLDVYVPVMADIKAINTTLFTEYKKTGTVALVIYYYDTKQAAKTYSKKLFDKKTTDKEIDALSKHVTGKFEYLALHNTRTLHVGKEADTY